MKTSDYSREILEKYFSKKDRILKVTLKDNSVIYGIFVSYFHGDENTTEPFISRWHFIEEKNIEKHHNLTSIDSGEDYGIIIKQNDIKSVDFKNKTP